MFNIKLLLSALVYERGSSFRSLSCLSLGVHQFTSMLYGPTWWQRVHRRARECVRVALRLCLNLARLALVFLQFKLYLSIVRFTISLVTLIALFLARLKMSLAGQISVWLETLRSPWSASVSQQPRPTFDMTKGSYIEDDLVDLLDQQAEEKRVYQQLVNLDSDLAIPLRGKLTILAGTNRYRLFQAAVVACVDDPLFPGIRPLLYAPKTTPFILRACLGLIPFSGWREVNGATPVCSCPGGEIDVNLSEFDLPYIDPDVDQVRQAKSYLLPMEPPADTTVSRLRFLIRSIRGSSALEEWADRVGCVSLAGGGYLMVYHVGVCHGLRLVLGPERFDQLLFAGASAGAVVSAAMVAGSTPLDALYFCLAMFRGYEESSFTTMWRETTNIAEKNVDSIVDGTVPWREEDCFHDDGTEGIHAEQVAARRLKEFNDRLFIANYGIGKGGFLTSSFTSTDHAKRSILGSCSLFPLFRKVVRVDESIMLDGTLFDNQPDPIKACPDRVPESYRTKRTVRASPLGLSNLSSMPHITPVVPYTVVSSFTPHTCQEAVQYFYQGLSDTLEYVHRSVKKLGQTSP